MVLGIGGMAWSKDVLSDKRDNCRLVMAAGMFFVVVCGWLLSQWMYNREV